MAGAQPKKPEKKPVPDAVEDRIRADSELVGQVLDPGRTSETVRYPDPEAPPPVQDGPGISSIAEAEMARRTDAGAAQPGAAAPVSRSPFLWPAAVVAVALVLLLLASI